MSIVYFTYAVIEWLQFLNITPLFLSSNRFATSSTPDPAIVIVPLTSMSASLESHKIDFKIEVLNSILLLNLYVPRKASFISMKFLF